MVSNHIIKALTQSVRHYRQNHSGQFAVWFALMAVPLITMLAYVGDMTYAGKVEADLKASLDSAAIAAVINQNLTESERAAFAETHFTENFVESDYFKLDVVNSSAERVELAAAGEIPSHMGAMLGRDTFGIKGSAASVLTSEDIICVLALDPDSAGAFSMVNDSKFLGVNCSVQVNSTHNTAAIVESGSKATAKSFCVSGGAVGSYLPYANTECARIDDPFEHLSPPSVIACDGNPKPGEYYANKGKKIRIEDNTSWAPGVYCDLVEITGENVTFLDGTHIFMDDVGLKQGAVVRGENVTLALSGLTSTLDVKAGSQIYLKAPASGTYAGLAVYQNTRPGNPLKSILKSGSGISIDGTVYLPSQIVEINKGVSTQVKNSHFPQASATSFIAYQIHLDGSDTQVAVDHKAADIPPILPRSDEGARLVQ